MLCWKAEVQMIECVLHWMLVPLEFWNVLHWKLVPLEFWDWKPQIEVQISKRIAEIPMTR